MLAAGAALLAAARVLRRTAARTADATWIEGVSFRQQDRLKQYLVLPVVAEVAGVLEFSAHTIDDPVQPRRLGVLPDLDAALLIVKPQRGPAGKINMAAASEGLAQVTCGAMGSDGEHGLRAPAVALASTSTN